MPIRLLGDAVLEVIEAARSALGVRRMYPELALGAVGESAETASDLEADARTRTGDPFITSVDQPSPPVGSSRAKPHQSRETAPPRWRAEDH